MTLTRSALAALAGTACAAALAGCSGSSSSTPQGVYAPYSGTSSTGGAPVASAGTAAGSGGAAVPAQPPTDFSALGQRFVALRNQGDRTLAGLRGRTSNSDLDADKAIMAQAATVFGSYAAQLRTLPFPPSMASDVSALVQVVSSIQSTLAQASQVSSFDQLDPLLQKLVDYNDEKLAATNAVEHDLGLPLSTPAPQS
jgi:hypothetical protein